MKEAAPQFLLTTFLLLALLLPTSAAGSTLELQVRPVYHGEPLLLDSLRYRQEKGDVLSFTRLSALLSGFALERSEGGWVEIPGRVAWIDAERRRLSISLDALPEGRYRALHFDVGLDPKTNAVDPATLSPEDPLNPNLNGLHWSWQGGYVFLAVEGRYRAPSGALSGYVYHLAREPNRTRIDLTMPLELSAHPTAVELDWDLATLLGAPQPLAFEQDGNTTHSRDGDPVSTALSTNLQGAFRVHQIVSSAPGITRRSPVQPLYLPPHFTPFRFVMDPRFPVPDLPRDNPLIEERVTLGEALFNETTLSRDGSIACNTCHLPEHGFADSKRFSSGILERTGTRNAMPLFNLAWKERFFWDGRAASLREQALVPIQDHAEMDQNLERLTAKLNADPRYQRLFAAAFDDPHVTAEKIGLAIEQYLLTLVSFDSRFDRAMLGKATLSDEEKRGLELFMTEYDPRTGKQGADCFHCHGGVLFADHQFHNNGLSPANEDSGRFRVSGLASDRGKFATPSLRNLTHTAPYMHDGRFATLEEVVEHYNHGVVPSDTLDPNLAKHPPGGLHLNEADRKALVAFLRCLSNE